MTKQSGKNDLVAAQNEADRMANTFSLAVGEDVTAVVYRGIGYVSLTFKFASLRGRERGVGFHVAAGLPAPKRVRGVEATWMF